MYIGRIGPIAMVTIFVNDEPVDKLLDYLSQYLDLALVSFLLNYIGFT